MNGSKIWIHRQPYRRLTGRTVTSEAPKNDEPSEYQDAKMVFAFHGSRDVKVFLVFLS